MLNSKLKFSFLVVVSLVVSACGGGGSDTIPVGGSPVTVTAVTTIESNVPGQLYQFGTSVAFSPDGLTLAVGEPASTSLGSGFTVQLFNKVATQWIAGPVIPGATFGEDLAFSPDGTTLAVMNRGNTVHFFLKLNNSWANAPTIGPLIKAPIAGLGTPSAIKFSPDGATFAISSVLTNSANGVANAGAVHLYSKNNNSWSNAPAVGPILEALLPVINGGFGYSIAFSYPKGNTLAVGDVGVNNSPGKVVLFSKNLDTWSKIPTELTATVPAVDDLFGASVEFSPDETTLAVGQSGAFSVSGSVQLFSRNGASWTVAPISGQLLISKDTQEPHRFGNALAFNHDGTVLAVTARSGLSSDTVHNGNVQLFNYSNFNWTRGVVLLAKSAGSDFGASIAFSAQQNGGVNSTIAVGQIGGNSSTIDDAGVVNIFEDSELP